MSFDRLSQKSFLPLA